MLNLSLKFLNLPKKSYFLFSIFYNSFLGIPLNIIPLLGHSSPSGKKHCRPPVKTLRKFILGQYTYTDHPPPFTSTFHFRSANTPPRPLSFPTKNNKNFLFLHFTSIPRHVLYIPPSTPTYVYQIGIGIDKGRPCKYHVMARIVISC